MIDTLKVGDKTTVTYIVGESKMVPELYPEFEEYQKMPRVFATGFMVGLLEWSAIVSLSKLLESDEGSLGTFVNIRHCAPTPAGARLTVTATCIRSTFPYFEWEVRALDDEGEVAAEGIHGRNIIEVDRFLRRVERKKLNLQEHCD